MDRNYQPSLLWSLALAWYEAQRGPDAQPLGPIDLTLYVYRTDTAGAYMMHGPKLYWTDEPMSGQYFTNCDQGSLADHAQTVGEVVLWDRRARKTVVLGKTYDQAWARINA